MDQLRLIPLSSSCSSKSKTISGRLVIRVANALSTLVLQLPPEKATECTPDINAWAAGLWETGLSMLQLSSQFASPLPTDKFVLFI